MNSNPTIPPAPGAEAGAGAGTGFRRPPNESLEAWI
jgi:hypothetical protein